MRIIAPTSEKLFVSWKPYWEKIASGIQQGRFGRESDHKQFSSNHEQRRWHYPGQEDCFTQEPDQANVRRITNQEVL